MTRFHTTEAYHLRLRINQEIESMRIEENREKLDDSRLYFDFGHDGPTLTYMLTISFWPRMQHSPSVLKAKRVIKLPQVIYKPMFLQLWYPLYLDDCPVVELGHSNDFYPHALSALTDYLPTQNDMKLWEAASM